MFDYIHLLTIHHLQRKLSHQVQLLILHPYISHMPSLHLQQSHIESDKYSDNLQLCTCYQYKHFSHYQRLLQVWQKQSLCCQDLIYHMTVQYPVCHFLSYLQYYLCDCQPLQPFLFLLSLRH